MAPSTKPERRLRNPLAASASEATGGEMQRLPGSGSGSGGCGNRAVGMPAPVLHCVWHSPSPYMDHFFDELARSLPGRLQVHYMQSRSPMHYWTEHQGRRPWARVYRKRLGIDWQLLRSVVQSRNAVLLTGCWQDPASELAMLWSIAARKPFYVFNDTPSPYARRNPVKAALRRLLLFFLLRRAACVLATGPMAMAALEKLGARRDRLTCFPYFIDSARFQPAGRAGYNTPLRIGCCGRLHQSKGIDMAIRAVARLREIDPRPVCLSIAGEGPEREPLRRLAQAEGIAAEVEFRGWVSDENLPAFYRGLDIFLHPARFEPYGVVVLEAMASGLITIASDQTGAAADRIRHRESGFIHRSGCERSLVGALREAVALQPHEIRRMRQAAVNSANSWPASRGAALLQTLLSGGAR